MVTSDFEKSFRSGGRKKKRPRGLEPEIFPEKAPSDTAKIALSARMLLPSPGSPLLRHDATYSSESVRANRYSDGVT